MACKVFCRKLYKPFNVDKKYLFLVGIMDEICEYEDCKPVNKKKEIGDVLSYCLLSCDAL
jgi:hypothetical protein